MITRTVSIYYTASGVSFIISNNDSIDRTHLFKRKPPTYCDNNTISVLFTPSSGRHDALRDPTCRQPLRCLHERPRPRCRLSAARFMHHLVTSSSTAFVHTSRPGATSTTRQGFFHTPRACLTFNTQYHRICFRLSIAFKNTTVPSDRPNSIFHVESLMMFCLRPSNSTN